MEVQGEMQEGPTDVIVYRRRRTARARPREHGRGHWHTHIDEGSSQLTQVMLQPPRSRPVYDVTPFMDDHPGGDEVLLSATGKDATNDFEDVGHSDSAREMMEKYYIGEIDSSTVPLKRTYVPPQQAPYNPDKTPEFVIKILQFLVPLLILGLAFAVRHYTKEK